jgi:hypothetical protein
MQFSAAIAFVEAHGSAIEQARLAYLLRGTAPAPEIVGGLFAGQRSDGGWAPFWAPDYSSLDATCYHLAQAEPFGLITTTAAGGRALDLLRDRQRADGAWQENPPSISKLPPWLTPGDPATICYLTANCALWLTLRTEDSQACERAAALLETSLQAISIIDPPHIAWLAAALWYACGKIDRAEQALQQLVAHYPQLSAGALAWAVTSLHIAGVPSAHWFVTRSAQQLDALQRADGGWSSADGAAHDVHVTLEAIRALRSEVS